MSFQAIEHDLIKALKETYGVEEKKYWVACSGGLDSVALLYMLQKITPVFKYKLKVLYIHHGNSDTNKTQSDYRDKALSHVQGLCDQWSLEFKAFHSDFFLQTEEECRDFRISVFNELLSADSRVFLAHHKDDLFETLLIRLIRGTGPEGFKNPFSYKFERPLVEICGRAALEDYIKTNKIEYVEDPTNLDSEYLRNWLRKDWLPKLVEASHGIDPLKSSLIKLSEHLSQAESDFENILIFDQKSAGYFNLHDFMSFNQVQKKAIISNALHKIKKSGYTAGQVLEVLKLLERQERETEFSGIKWKKTKTKVCFNKV